MNKNDHHPIRLECELTKREEAQVLAIAKKLCQERKRFDDATQQLVKDYRRIVGYEYLDLSVLELMQEFCFDWEDPKSFVKEANDKRREWEKEALG